MERDAGGAGAELMGADATAGDHHHPATCADPVDGDKTAAIAMGHGTGEENKNGHPHEGGKPEEDGETG